MNKYLTSTEIYEKWKVKFRKEMQTILTSIFKRKIVGCFICVSRVDKWNVYFSIKGIERDLFKLKQDIGLKQILSIDTSLENTGLFCEIHARTEDEFNMKLGYLKMAI